MTQEHGMDESTTQGFLISQEELLEIARSHRDHAEFILKDKPEFLVPAIRIHVRKFPGGKENESIEFFAITTPFSEADEKLACMRAIARYLRRIQVVPVAVALFSEAWRSLQREGEAHIQPRDDPARQEAIMVMALALGQKQGVCIEAMINRDEQNRIVLGEWEELAGEFEPRLLAELFREFFRAMQF